MRARYHGEVITSGERRGIDSAPSGAAPSFGFMFGDLADDPGNRLPDGPQVLGALSMLGQAMAEDSSGQESGIPAAYTYFGQFIDHDITKTVLDATLQPPGGPDPIMSDDLRPLTRADAVRLITNARTAPLDLDSVYKGMAREAIDDDGRFLLSEVSRTTFFPLTLGDRLHDLKRRDLIENPQGEDIERDRQALIGDPRNDENLIVAQLHLAILRSHNKLMDERGLSGDDAQVAIRRRYQWAILHDFLPRICDRDVVRDVLKNGPTAWQVTDGAGLFMPFEFAGAAYRFGHSMVRGEYLHNSTFSRPPIGKVAATFNFFFTFTALSGDIQSGDGPSQEFATLPDNWPIEWHRFFGTKAEPASQNPARRIDANLTPELGKLRDFQGLPVETVMGRLAARNLRRGYMLGLPTGQAVAAKLGLAPLSREVLRSATPSGLKTEIEKAGLLDRTPLWFYVLAEAGDPDGPDGQHLGPVGSRIVAETLFNLAKHTKGSVLTSSPSEDEVASGEFTLKGLVKIGQDAAMPPLK